MQAESAEMPGGIVTLNPHVMAAKFVLGRQATTRDVEAMGKEIAKQIADSNALAQRAWSRAVTVTHRRSGPASFGRRARPVREAPP